MTDLSEHKLAKKPLGERVKHNAVWLFDHVKREWQIYVLITPMIIWFLLFLYTPMYGLQIAFKDYSIFKGVAKSPWAGLEHFETLFSNSQFIRAVKNTVITSGLTLLFGFPMPIILALMFNEILNATFKRRHKQSFTCRTSSRQ